MGKTTKIFNPYRLILEYYIRQNSSHKKNNNKEYNLFSRKKIFLYSKETEANIYS